MTEDLRTGLRDLAEQAPSSADWLTRLRRARKQRRQRVGIAAGVVTAAVAIPVAMALVPSSEADHEVIVAAPSATPSPPTILASPVATTVPPEIACPSGMGQHLSEDQPAITDSFICVQEERAFPEDGLWLVKVVRRITGGLEPLLVIYAEPDAGTGAPNTICPASSIYLPWIYLHSSEDVRVIRAPQTSCHQPTPEAMRAYRNLTTTVVWEQKVKRIPS